VAGSGDFHPEFYAGADLMNPISATIVTLNEEKNIGRAIESLRCCDEVVVVDSGSTDRTVAMAEKRGARVIHREWSGYAQQKNFAAAQASHDWIFSIDADEALGEELEAELMALSQRGLDADAYSMPRLAQYLGKWIRHSGWYPDRKVRLYDRRRAKWTGEYVHETVRVDGRVAELQSNLLHYTCDSLSAHMKSLDRYTTLAAREVIASGRARGAYRLLTDPLWTGFRTYILQRGFLDGYEGFTIAYMASLYSFLKYAKARRGE
jgi:glycosyltransferase involved in cell wall biosynthesis